MSTYTENLNYGSASLYGYFYDDKLCLGNAELCVSGFNFLGITSQQGLGSGQSGMLGLSP